MHLSDKTVVLGWMNAMMGCLDAWDVFKCFRCGCMGRVNIHGDQSYIEVVVKWDCHCQLGAYDEMWGFC